jgi:hypothetical protein
MDLRLHLVLLLHDIDTPDMSGLPFGNPESGGAIEMGGGGECADGPEDDPGVAGFAREADRLLQ